MKSLPANFVIRQEVDPKELAELYAAAGWNHKADATLCQRSLEHTPVLFTMYSTGRLIGCVRLATDYCQFAHIIDLVVHPEFRRRGIGGALVHRVIQFCNEHGFEEHQGELTLTAAHQADQFFSVFNFHRVSNGMFYKFRHLRKERTTKLTISRS